MTSMVASSSSNEKMEQVALPESLRKAGGWTPEELANEVRFLLAAHLLAEHRISMGRATELSGMGRAEFMKRTGEMGIAAIDLDEKELREEFRDD